MRVFRIMAPRADDPGIGTVFDKPVDRLVGADGSFLVHRVGARSGLSGAFIRLVTMRAWAFLLTLVSGYFIINLLFALLYLAVGVDGIGNSALATPVDRWLTALEMSVQTITTIGFGYLYPKSHLVWAVAAVEGMLGILSFSLTAAVLYARFAKPKASLAWSPKALIAPFRDGWSVQLRVANRRSSLLMELEARLLLVMADVDEQGERLNYYNLKLQLDRVSFLPLSWTIVHPIDSASALAGLSLQDLKDRRAELILILKGIDEGYMGPVYTRHSYRYDEIIWGARFARAFSSREGELRLDLQKLGDSVEVEAPAVLPT